MPKQWPSYDREHSEDPRKSGTVYWCDVDTMTRAGRFQATASSKHNIADAEHIAVEKLKRIVTTGLKVYDKAQARNPRQ